MTNIVKPEDILGDNDNFAKLGEQYVRKGSIAAFVANINILEKLTLAEDKSLALNALADLAPAIVASGLSKHVIFKNDEVQKIIDNAVGVTRSQS